MAGNLHPGLYTLGVIVKVHGTRGGFLLEVEDPDLKPDLVELVYLFSSEKQWVPYRVTEMRPHFDRRRNLFFVILEGIDSRTEAASLKGQEIMSDHEFSSDVEPIPVIGYRVIREDGSTLGVVSDILSTPAYDVFVVKSRQKNILIPNVEEYISSVSEKSERINVRNTTDLENLE